MQIGVVFPQIEYESSPAAIRDYAQTAEALGYTHILAYDHVLGANPDRPGGWQGPYTYHHPFQEPFVMFGFMAGITQRIGFATGVIILPQRQTVLVAKQAAELDVLCGGRLRLGVGLGWNTVEYAALNEDFHTRGKRIEEQVAVMRQLWTQPLVNFSGRWHKLLDAGINPLPVQRPIPVWFGGQAEAALRRIAALGDGWMLNYRTAPEAQAALDLLRAEITRRGRDPQQFGLEARLPYGDGDPQRWQETLQGWRDAGVTHLSVNTMGCGFTSPGEHLKALEKFASPGRLA
jgi:probable F420-dependent oxidoreductase